MGKSTLKCVNSGIIEAHALSLSFSATLPSFISANRSFVSVNRFSFIFIKIDGIALFLMCIIYTLKYIEQSAVHIYIYINTRIQCVYASVYRALSVEQQPRHSKLCDNNIRSRLCSSRYQYLISCYYFRSDFSLLCHLVLYTKHTNKHPYTYIHKSFFPCHTIIIFPFPTSTSSTSAVILLFRVLSRSILLPLSLRSKRMNFDFHVHVNEFG